MAAKIDFFRRHNIDVSQEQVLPYYRISADDYVKALREESGEESDDFWAVFFIDDFTGSGYTLLRTEVDQDTDHIRFSGSLERTYEQHQKIVDRAVQFSCVSTLPPTRRFGSTLACPKFTALCR